MPWKEIWVNPEVFCRVKGTPVYHAYKDGKWGRVLGYEYTLYPDPLDDELFDIRDLKAYTEAKQTTTSEDDFHKAVLRLAFKTGELPGRWVLPSGS